MFPIAFFSSRHSLSSMRKQPTERTAKDYECAATPILSQRSSLDHFANPSLVSPRNYDETSGTWWRREMWALFSGHKRLSAWYRLDSLN